MGVTKEMPSFPLNPWPLWGVVADQGVNVQVTAENLSTHEFETCYTSSDGSFILDAANFPTGYNEELGDIIRITAGVYYAEASVDTFLYPAGREVNLNKLLSILTGGGVNKFSHMEDRWNAIPGSVGACRSGLR